MRKPKKHKKKELLETDEDLEILEHVRHRHRFNMKEFLEDGTTALKDAVKNVNVSQIKEKVNTVMYANMTQLKDNWKEHVMETTQYGEPFLRFTLTAIISAGALLKLIYLSYGLSGLPIYLIRGTRSLESESTEISGSFQQVREKLRRIQEKYQKTQRAHISTKDQA